MGWADVKKLAREAVRKFPIKITFVEEDDADSNCFAPSQRQRRKFTSSGAQCSSGTRQKKVRLDEAIDPDGFLQDNPDIEDEAYHTATRHDSKLEDDHPSTDPWEKVRPHIHKKLVTIAAERSGEVKDRKERERLQVQQRIDDACSRCSRCGLSSTKDEDALGNREVQVSIESVFFVLAAASRHPNRT